MTHKPYKWNAGGKGAVIKQHSVAKHEVLRAYLMEYVQTLIASPHQDSLRLTIVDGFAGGGIYVHEATRQTVYGSPLVILEAISDAQAIVNAGRSKPVAMEVDYFFVEVARAACASLQRTLIDRGYGARIGNDIQVMNSEFELKAEDILSFIKTKSPRNGRSIFVLDQYGYSDVPAPLVRSIFSTLPAAEVLLTFAVDSFINYATDSGGTQRLLDHIGIPDVLRGRRIEDIKRSERDFRLFIQSCLYHDLVEACGARFYTLFFIRTEGHGDYWLVHLSQHPRARDVMTRVHWTKNNQFIHYGGAGIDMFHALGYTAGNDSSYTGQSNLGFCFDDPASDSSVTALTAQLPSLIYAREDGLSFAELFATTCNTSPADSTLYKQALEKLVGHKEIDIFSAQGRRRKKATTISDQDQIVRASQRHFVF